ncbi:hypothetical protein D9M69_592930 [compost metagenome]
MISTVSRAGPSITTPTMPSLRQAFIMMVPINAELRSPLPSMTSTSPGLASEIAA